jgi:hypothetical protein
MNDTWYVVPAQLALRGVGRSASEGNTAPRMLLVYPMTTRVGQRKR